MSQAAGRQFLSMETRVRSQYSPYEVFGIISGTDANTRTISAILLHDIINREACRLCRKRQYAY